MFIIIVTQQWSAYYCCTYCIYKYQALNFILIGFVESELIMQRGNQFDHKIQHLYPISCVARPYFLTCRGVTEWALQSRSQTAFFHLYLWLLNPQIKTEKSGLETRLAFHQYSYILSDPCNTVFTSMKPATC